MYFLKHVTKDFIKKLLHMKKWKGFKKDSRSFYKRIPFAPLNVFAPAWVQIPKTKTKKYMDFKIYNGYFHKLNFCHDIAKYDYILTVL
jgi:hypothetical protein